MIKFLIILFASLLSAQTITTTFKTVNYNGVTLKNIVMIADDESHTIELWYRQILMLEDYSIVSCKTREGYCLIEKKTNYGWIETER